MLTERHRADLPAVIAAEDRTTAAPGWLTLAEAVHGSATEGRVVLVDVLVLALALRAAGITRAAAIVGIPAFVIAAAITRLYRHRGTVEAVGVTWYLRLLPAPLLALGAVLSVAGVDSADVLLPAVAAAAAALLAVRATTWMIVSRARQRNLGLRPALLIGSPRRVAQVERRLSFFPDRGLEPSASYSPPSLGGSDTEVQLRYVRHLLQRGELAHVLVLGEGDGQYDDVLTDLRRGLGDTAAECSMVLPSVGASQCEAVGRIGDLGILPLGRLSPRPPRMWAKRLIDIAVSATLLIFLAPVLLLVSLAIWLYDHGPVIYRQRRVGLDNQEFWIWKFRSMVPNADSMMNQLEADNISNGLLFKLSDDPRVTPVGHLIRRLSLDELPQFINVLRGDMSLVGPRPLPVDPEDFDAVAARRHRVRPGITGPWQVAGGHVMGYEEMIKLDLAYVDSWSVRQDLWLLFMTVPTVLLRRSSAY
ncbi:MAG: sugar transferase [Acidimicrobiia bacterium]|nr:sugar transferase [Acidimicrobiia bacterium]